MIEIPWITLTVFLPLVGAGLLAFVPSEHRALHRNITLIFMGLTFLVSIPLVTGFDASIGTWQLTTAIENVEWIKSIGARYHVGVDGISLWLVMLTTFLGPIVTLASYSAIQERVKEYHIALLVIQTAMIGTFVALDVLLFYIFWELMLVPMYALIGIWGGQERVYAAVKLFLYTMVGSVLMLVGILYIYVSGGSVDFSIDAMTVAAQNLDFTAQRFLFVAFALAFLIKVPLFPLHTWLPDAHVQAPTAGSVILASILLKMGIYGLMRFAMPMMPDAVFWAAPTIAALSVIGIIYGALVAFVQKDVKKLIAYSSVSHLGFVTLGLFAMTATSITGGLYLSLAHGITTGGLFLAIGIIYERRHTRLFSEFGGLAKQVPIFAAFFVIISLASAGTPGLVGFIGEFLILSGSASSYTLTFTELFYFFGLDWGPDVSAFLFVALATSGVILGALYLLFMVQKMLYGPLDNPKNQELKDLNGRELTYMIPMVLMCFIMGLFPQVFLNKMDASIDRLVDTIETGAKVYGPAVRTNDERNNDYREWLRDRTSAPAEDADAQGPRS